MTNLMRIITDYVLNIDLYGIVMSRNIFKPILCINWARSGIYKHRECIRIGYVLIINFILIAISRVTFIISEL